MLGPGVVIGPGAEIGDGARIGANAVIGPGVAIGHGCEIGSNVSISHAYIGDRVMILPGAQIGQPGFGFASSPAGHVEDSPARPRHHPGRGRRSAPAPPSTAARWATR